MKNFEIHCVIYDKLNPSNELDEVVSIELFTIVTAADPDSAVSILNNLYKIKEILSIQEII